MRAQEFITETKKQGPHGAGCECELDEKTSPKLCRSTKKLGSSDQSSCVSQGLRPHKTGHTDGYGHYLNGKKAKGKKYGGKMKHYPSDNM